MTDDEWKALRRGVRANGNQKLSVTSMKQNDSEAYNALVKFQGMYKEAAKDIGFNGVIGGSLRYDMVHDRFDRKELNVGKKGEMMSLLKNNLVTLKGMESFANLGGINTFKGIMEEVYAKYGSPEALQKEMKENPYSVVKTMFDIADKKMEYFDKKDQKIKNHAGNRFKTGSLDKPENELRVLMEEMNGYSERKEATQMDGLSALAERMLIENDEGFARGYSQKDLSRHDSEGVSIRPDCSGYVSAVLRRYEKASGGQLEAGMHDAVHRIASSAELYEKHLAAAGGKEDFYLDASKMSAAERKEAKKKLTENLKEGSVIYFGNKDNKDIGHVGIVVKGKDGELYVANQLRDKKWRMTKVSEFMSSSGKFLGWNNIHAIHLNKAFVKQGNALPSNSRNLGPSGLDEKAVEQATRAAERRVEQYNTPGNDYSGKGMDQKEYEYAKAWYSAENLGGLGQDRLLEDLGKQGGLGPEFGGGALDRALTKKKDGGDSNLENLLVTLTRKGWKQFADYKKEGKDEWNAIITDIVKQSNPDMSEEDIKKKTAELMQNDDFMRTLQATIMNRYYHVDKDGKVIADQDVYNGVDYGVMFDHAKTEGIDALGKVTSRRTDGLNQSHNDFLLTNQFDNVLGIYHYKGQVREDDGTFSEFQRYESERFGDLKSGKAAEAYGNAREALKTAMTKQGKVKGTSFKEGHYYEQTANLMNLFHEYTVGDHSKDDKKRIRERLVSLAKSGGISETKLNEILKDSSRASDFATKFFKEAGLKTTGDDDVQKLINSIQQLLGYSRDGKVDVNTMLARSSDTIGGSGTDKKFLEHQVTGAFLRLQEYTGASYKDFHDKTKVSDTAARQAIDLFRKNGYNSVAQLLEEARKNGTAIDPIALTRAVNKANPDRAKAGANGDPYKPGQKGSDTSGGGGYVPGGATPPVSGGVGPGVGGLWDDPQVKNSMIQLSPNLEENTKVLREVKTLLEQGRVTPMPNGNKNN